MSPMAALGELVSCASIPPKTQRLQSVSYLIGKAASLRLTLTSSIAKFTGYQYGGRPLGLSFVRYLNTGPSNGVDGGHPPPPIGITQDQIM